MLTSRLRVIANQIEGANNVIDIGCDHGYLGITLLKEKKAQHVIFSDVNKLPLEQAFKNIQKHNLVHKSTLILQDGFGKKQINFDIAVIAGMGGKLITDIILSNNNYKKNQIIITSPNNASNYLRKVMNKQNFKITDEILVKDNGIIYEIIILQKTEKSQKLSESEIELGFNDHNSNLFYEKLTTELIYLQKLIKKIPVDNNNYLKINKRINLILKRLGDTRESS